MSLNTELFSFLNLNRLAGKNFLVAKRIVFRVVVQGQACECIAKDSE